MSLMAYTDAVNRNDELSFELYSGRSANQSIKTVLKYNFDTGEYESTILHPFESEFSLVKLVRYDIDLPEGDADLRLSNYPNPFTNITTISYSLPENTRTDLSIYNLKGQKVKTMAAGEITQGEQQITWDGTDENNKSLTSGIYMYRLETPGMILIR